MAEYSTIFLGSEEIASETLQFEFEKPQGFVFKPGQFVHLGLPDLFDTDSEGNSRSFSIASAPHESHLLFAMRMRDSAFKNHLKSAVVGTSAVISGPLGNFIFPDKTDRLIVFLVGGIGITPVRGMIVHASQTKSPQKIIVFYSNRTGADMPYVHELVSLNNQNIQIIPTMTNDASWIGEQGYIDLNMISRHLTDINEPIYYLSGSPEFVLAMDKLLRDAGVKDIIVAEFFGY
ncbi:MAG: FAD-dependent oxidoreductase [Nanoarchaeota archaeon]